MCAAVYPPSVSSQERSPMIDAFLGMPRAKDASHLVRETAQSVTRASAPATLCDPDSLLCADSAPVADDRFHAQDPADRAIGMATDRNSAWTRR